MKKIINCILIILILLGTFLPFNVKAATHLTVTASGGLAFRSGSSTDSTKIGSLPYGTVVELLQPNPIPGTGCTKGWYNVRHDGKDGYVCAKYVSNYVQQAVATEREPANDMEREWQNLGFPSSYWEGLTALKTAHPNWTFKAINTGLEWSEAVASESAIGVSLIQVTDLSSDKVAYISTMAGSYDYTAQKYIPLEGSSWYAADSEVVAYYMDPRNFLNESRIFMFEDLTYSGNYITKETIDEVFGVATKVYLQQFSQSFVDAGVVAGVNPVYLAALTRQELGSYSSVAVSGAEFCYPEANYNYESERGKCYSGYYNFFNIGAGTDRNPIYNSLIYAKNKGWDTPLKAITGGANYIGNGYILKGQNTSYFKRFNVKPGAASSTYSHQYMTNIQAPYSEASTSYNAYKDMGLLEANSTIPFVFEIPVYKNMPQQTMLPTSVKFQEGVGATVIDGLLSNTTIKNDGTYLSGFTVGEDVGSLLNKISNVSSTATVTIVDISGNAKTSGALVTGDRVNITYDGESQQYTVVIYGDASGDGGITIADLLAVQKQIINISLMDGAYLKAADVNHDGSVTIADLLAVQKHIIGISTITE